MLPVNYTNRTSDSFRSLVSNSQNPNLQRRHSISNLNSEKTKRTTDETLFQTLMSDPLKKAFLLNMLSQEKENIEKYKRENTPKKTRLKNHQRGYCESPTALLRRRALEKQRDSDASSTSSRSSRTSLSSVEYSELLHGVVAYVEIRSNDADRSAGAKLLMQSMGATISDTLNRKVTHVVFKDGSFGTYQKAKLLKAHLVSVLWLEAIRKSNSRVPEKEYPALGTETYDINVTAIYQDYENVVQDEVRRSLAVCSQRSTMNTQRRARLTALPHELSSSKYTVSSSSNSDLQLPERVSDIIPSSQNHETESIISLRRDTRRNSATLNDLEDVEMTSDDDSDCGVINGHSIGHLRDPLLSDLDMQICSYNPQSKDDSSTKNQTYDTSSSRSVSLLSRKSAVSTRTTRISVDMELTNAALDQRVNSDRRKTVGCSKELKSNLLTSDTTRLSLPVERDPTSNVSSQDHQTKLTPCNSKDSETMPSLRISADSTSLQGATRQSLRLSKSDSLNSENLQELRISTDSELRINNNAQNAGMSPGETSKSARSSKSGSYCSLNGEAMPELQTSTDSGRINQENLKVAKKAKSVGTRKSLRSSKSDSLNSENMPELRIPTDSELGMNNNAENAGMSPRETSKSARSSKSGSYCSLNGEAVPELQTSTDSGRINRENLKVAKKAKSVGTRKSVSSSKSDSLNGGNIPELRGSTNSEIKINEETSQATKAGGKKRPAEEENGAIKKLRKLYNLNQPISKTMEYPTEPRRNTNLMQKTLTVPLTRLILIENTNAHSNKHKRIIVRPIKTKKKEISPTSKKLKKVVKSAKKVVANTENDEQKALAAHFHKNGETSKKSQTQSGSRENTEQLDEEDSNQISKPVSKRRASLRIHNRRSTLEFVQIPASQPRTQKSQKIKRNKSSIVCTRMHKPDVQMFIQIVRKLGVYFAEDEVNAKTTHLVVGESKRTINLLRAICRGCWIVTQEWLLKSLESGKWLAEEDYELTDFSPAVRQCRRERQVFGDLYSMDIFSDCDLIFISRGSIPRRSDLEELVVLCKGTIVKEIFRAKIVVGDWVGYEGVVCVSEKWILDSITNNKKKSFKKYLITYRN